MAQWIQYLNAVAQVTVELQVWSLAFYHGLKGSGVAPVTAWVTAVAQIQFLAQELPYAMDVAIKFNKTERKSSLPWSSSRYGWMWVSSLSDYETISTSRIICIVTHSACREAGRVPPSSCAWGTEPCPAVDESVVRWSYWFYPLVS